MHPVAGVNDPKPAVHLGASDGVPGRVRGHREGVDEVRPGPRARGSRDRVDPGHLALVEVVPHRRHAQNHHRHPCVRKDVHERLQPGAVDRVPFVREEGGDRPAGIAIRQPLAIVSAELPDDEIRLERRLQRPRVRVPVEVVGARQARGVTPLPQHLHAPKDLESPLQCAPEVGLDRRGAYDHHPPRRGDCDLGFDRGRRRRGRGRRRGLAAAHRERRFVERALVHVQHRPQIRQPGHLADSGERSRGFDLPPRPFAEHEIAFSLGVKLAADVGAQAKGQTPAERQHGPGRMRRSAAGGTGRRCTRHEFGSPEHGAAARSPGGGGRRRVLIVADGHHGGRWHPALPAPSAGALLQPVVEPRVAPGAAA